MAARKKNNKSKWIKLGLVLAPLAVLYYFFDVIRGFLTPVTRPPGGTIEEPLKGKIRTILKKDGFNEAQIATAYRDAVSGIKSGRWNESNYLVRLSKKQNYPYT